MRVVDFELKSLGVLDLDLDLRVKILEFRLPKTLNLHVHFRKAQEKRDASTCKKGAWDDTP